MFRRNSDLLRKVAETEARESDLAVVKGLLAKDNTEKSGLPGAIDANDADFVGRLKVKIAVVVDDFRTVGKMKMGSFH